MAAGGRLPRRSGPLGRSGWGSGSRGPLYLQGTRASGPATPVAPRLRGAASESGEAGNPGTLGMTNLFGNAKDRFQDELSSRAKPRDLRCAPRPFRMPVDTLRDYSGFRQVPSAETEF